MSEMKEPVSKSLLKAFGDKSKRIFRPSGQVSNLDNSNVISIKTNIKYLETWQVNGQLDGCFLNGMPIQFSITLFSSGLGNIKGSIIQPLNNQINGAAVYKDGDYLSIAVSLSNFIAFVEAEIRDVQNSSINNVNSVEFHQDSFSEETYIDFQLPFFGTEAGPLIIYTPSIIESSAQFDIYTDDTSFLRYPNITQFKRIKEASKADSSDFATAAGAADKASKLDHTLTIRLNGDGLRPAEVVTDLSGTEILELNSGLDPITEEFINNLN